MSNTDARKGDRLLNSVRCPNDLKRFSRAELKTLANEVRQAIIENVSRTGGHFASNLGTVELTIALYATYEFPPDAIIWDTGHQAYPHKILTDRLGRFDTLRQYGGISGFLRREESPFDLWGAGHACTAISAAVGWAAARDQAKRGERVVAIAGDASLTGGMAWEALNNAGDLQTDLTIILNDNKMSIAENVGAVTTYLAKLRARPWFQSLELQAKHAVERLPKPLVKTAAGLKHSVTHYVAPEETGAIFEEIGLHYIGPIDGHNLDVMLDVFGHAKELKGPVFIHAITVKGKGYEFAETDARTWHGVTPFGIEDGKLEKKSSGVPHTQVFAETLIDEARRDPKVVAITAAMPDGTGLNKFKQEFPERFFDVGIAEQHAVTFAAGLAAAGAKPVAAIYSTFLQRAFDMVLHDVCIQNLPVRLMLDRAGLVGDDGPTHHGVFDFSYLGLMPNIVIVAPRDLDELREMVRFAVRFDSGPIAVRYPRGSTPETDWPKRRTKLELGRAETLSEGDDVTIAAIGSMVAPAWAAAQSLRENGVSAGVINARFAKPIDEATILEAACRTGRLVLVEENVARGGFGQAVLGALAASGITDVRVKHLAVPDKFIEHGAVSLLQRDCGLTAEGIAAAAAELLFGEAVVPQSAAVART